MGRDKKNLIYYKFKLNKLFVCKQGCPTNSSDSHNRDGLICIQYDEFLTTRLHLFYNPSSVFDTLRFACVFIQALESSCKSISGCLLSN